MKKSIVASFLYLLIQIGFAQEIQVKGIIVKNLTDTMRGSVGEWLLILSVICMWLISPGRFGELQDGVR